MPDLSTIGLFVIACLALTATPGPDMLLIASRSASQGRASGLATYAGIAAGTYCHALAAAFGLCTRFRRAPQILLGTVFAGLAARLAFGGQR
ncbi:LysE family transporter [Mesorhizobium sp. B2-4-19]|uniref:LysE family translocator n=1 Tax=Mesorhizobium sp. B2-4-19 TaxID=2589930 RepID=UPI0024847732|nr:LysE family transporter [Mesorhizobium sp. B2-4-19]